MTACTQPGCTGTIVDNYCDLCGSPAGAPPFIPEGATASAAPPAPAATADLTAGGRGSAFTPRPGTCTQPGCTGTIADGYCDVCGSPASAAPSNPVEAAQQPSLAEEDEPTQRIPRVQLTAQPSSTEETADPASDAAAAGTEKVGEEKVDPAAARQGQSTASGRPPSLGDIKLMIASIRADTKTTATEPADTAQPDTEPTEPAETDTGEPAHTDQVDTDTTEPIDTEAAHTEQPDTDTTKPIDAEAAHTDQLDTDTTKPIDTEQADTEPADTDTAEQAHTEQPDTDTAEPIDTEPVDTEKTDTAPSGLEDANTIEMAPAGAVLSAGRHPHPQLPEQQQVLGPVPVQKAAKKKRLGSLAVAAAILAALLIGALFFASRDTGDVTAQSDATVTPTPTATVSTSPTERSDESTGTGADESTIHVEALTDPARPSEAVRIQGTYRGGADTFLRVQRWEGGRWLDFPVPTKTDQSGHFTTYVQLGQPGRYQLRMIDPDTGLTSRPFGLVIMG